MAHVQDKTQWLAPQVRSWDYPSRIILRQMTKADFKAFNIINYAPFLDRHRTRFSGALDLYSL
ncbi:hypothetical protein [Microvirga sp. M2]|uniref:hypothetical protein n=1 Tax=Microvirga sp. M2 TaxID=3073270 RepID=UPI0039C4324F